MIRDSTGRKTVSGIIYQWQEDIKLHSDKKEFFACPMRKESMLDLDSFMDILNNLIKLYNVNFV